MSNPRPAPRPVEPAANQPAPKVVSDVVQELKVSGHLMTLPAGLFAIVNRPHPNAQAGGLPGVRISPPPLGGAAEITTFRPDGWLSPSGDAALVRIAKGPAQILVTIYQQPNLPDAAPKLQVRQLLEDGDIQPVPAQPAPAPAAGPAPEIMDMMAHIQTRGDVGAKFAAWLGDRGSQNWIEGFAIAPPQGVDAADLSYQAVLGRGWLSPWVEAGQYCGSRGMALPLLGLRVRLQGEAEELYEVAVSATFVDGSAAGPVGNDETCEGPNLAPLEAIMISLTPKPKKTPKAKR